MASSCSTVSITDIPVSLLRGLFVPAPVPDHAQKLAAVILCAARVEDGDIGLRRCVADATRQPFSDIAVTVPRAGGKPLRQHIRRRRDRDHHDVCIGLAQRAYYR